MATPNQPTDNNLDTPPVNDTPMPINHSVGKPKSGATRLVLGIILIAIIAIGVALLVHHKPNSLTNSSNPPAYVSITSNGFDPATITIKPNKAVVWTNNDTKAHQVASDPYPSDNALAGFKSASAINNGQTYSFVFNKAGSYSYHDDKNPSTFKGTVVVK